MSAPANAAQKRLNEDDDVLQLHQLQKSQVLHEAKAFNISPLDIRKCCSVLTELLCLLSQGEILGKEEATPLFFGVTKLFQSTDPPLRRLVYLVIKELNKNQDDAFIVISSLEKDINGSVELFRANALRVHSKVIDASMLEQRARLFSQAIVNPNEHIACSALCAGIRMFQSNPDVIRRWVNEIRETTKSSKKMVPFHGLHLLYKIHKRDPKAIMRLVTSMINRPPESPLARCLLIRYAFSCLNSREEPPKNLLEFIKAQINQYKNPMVMFEAAKALCYIPNVSESDLTVAMNVLQEFLNSPRPVQRFAAVRALSNIVNRFNNILSPSCTVDLEHLITDSNRNIATLAITTLLKTTAEYSIERLLTSITDFMADIADELKIVLMDAIKKVCEKFPNKYEPLLGFLTMALREEGGYIYKSKIVDCMLILMENLDRAKECGLDALCEFIEDCEYPQLSVRILHLIGVLGPKTSHPSRYIRFIFNRVLLELPCVRSAAVSCLTRCAIMQPSLHSDILLLLQRSLMDEDDEVRDRATLYSELLSMFDKNIVQQVIDNSNNNNNNKEENQENEDENEEEEEKDDEKQNMDNEQNKKEIIQWIPPKDLSDIIIVPELKFSLENLEESLLLYITENENREQENMDDNNNNNIAYLNEFNIDNVEDYIDKKQKDSLLIPSPNKAINIGSTANPSAIQQLDIYSQNPESKSMEEWDSFIKLKQNDLPKNLGQQITYSNIELLTEPENEYQADVIKRIYKNHIILQFNIQQGIEKQLLTDVYVEVDCDECEMSNITCPIIKYSDTGIALCIMERDESNPYILGKYECVLKFITKDDTGDNTYEDEEGYDDSYQLNELEISHRDYILNKFDDKENNEISILGFKKKWTELDAVKQFAKKGQLGSNIVEIEKAVKHVINKVGLMPVEDSDIVKPDAQQHALNLIGTTVNFEPILMRAAFVQNDNSITYKAAIRSPNQLLAAAAIRSFQ